MFGPGREKRTAVDLQKAYVDIETSFDHEITVVGIYRSDQDLLQIVGEAIDSDTILESLSGIDQILTYNGSRFDLPVIRNCLDLDLTDYFVSRDLMYDCWRHNLYGGLKKVEQMLGIDRELPGVDGFDAMRLWAKYEMFDDEEALMTLLTYNRDDILNLPALEAKLEELDRGSGPVVCEELLQ